MPSMYVVPQLEHSAAPNVAVARVPQCPQNASMGSVALPHLMHAMKCGSGSSCGAIIDVELRGGVSVRPAELAGIPIEPDGYAGAARIADADIGFPQSIQKRDMGSLSRPQKAQETKGVTGR
ncbi:MAG: hypothetical protein ABJE47_23755 [bacterium]